VIFENMGKKFTLPSCDDHRIYINHKQKRVIMSPPVKGKMFNILYRHFLIYWVLILVILLFVNSFIFFSNFSKEGDKSNNFLKSMLKVASFIESLILLVLIPPLIFALILLKNPKYLVLIAWQL